MKNQLILIVLLASISIAQSFGAYLKNVPQKIKQPDGTTLSCLATGDEYYHWLHDADNFTIIHDYNTGYFVYADLVNGELVPTSLTPGIDSPASHGLEPGLNLSGSKIKELRRNKYKIPKLKGFSGTNNVGTLNNLVVFIRFSDQSEYTTAKSYYDNSFNGTNQVSMYEYYKEVSNDQLTINTTLFPQTGGTTVMSFQDTLPRDYYRPYDQTTNSQGYSNDTERKLREHTLLKYATETLQTQIEGTGLDYDMDNDGYVDNIAYIIQGATDGWSELLWPHMWALYSFDVRINGNRVWNYNFQLSDAFGVSVLCHEMFHSLGAPDLYRYENDDITPIGAWDLMSWNRTPPQHMGAYMKMKYGKWFNSIPEISTAGTYTLSPLTTTPFAAYKISSPNSSSEYFVIEYRKASGRFETSLPGSGLIVYRVNESINGNSQGPPDELYIYRPNGTTTVDGSVNSAYLSSGSGRTEINDATNPASFLSDGSTGGLNISNIGTAGTTISFDVSFASVGFSSPSNLIATDGSNYIDLTWTLPDAGGATLLGFNIYRGGQLLTNITDPTATSYTDQALLPGTYTYSATALYINPAGESDPSNEASATILEYLPDLIIQNITLSVGNTDAGSTILVAGSMLNEGNASSGTCTLKIYLSENSEYTASAVELKSLPASALAVNEEFSFSEPVQIPDNLTTGNYYILVIADAEEEVDETDESDNTSFEMIGVRAAYPDLEINSLVIVPDFVAAGSTTQLTASWSNIGNRASNSCNVAVVISDDREFDEGDQVVLRESSPALSQGEQYNFQADIEIPDDLSTGNYFFVLFLDENDEVAESNESNNSDYQAFEVSGYDIQLHNLSFTPSVVKDGENIDLQLTIKNQGNIDINNFDLHIALDETNIKNESSILETFNIVLVRANEEISFSRSLQIPQGTPEGTYYIQVFTDDDLIDDPDQSNNYLFRQIDVFNLPDIQISISGNSLSLKPYEPLELSIELTNSDTGDANNFNVDLLLSSDQIADAEDITIEQYPDITVLSQERQSLEFSYQFDEDILAGDYYIIALADGNSQVIESNEQNNIDIWSFEVLDVSSKEQLSNSISWIIYPNPVNDKLHLIYSGSGSSQALLKVYSLSGRSILEQSLSLYKNSRFDLSLGHLSEGLYFIQILSADSLWQRRIMIIE